MVVVSMAFAGCAAEKDGADGTQSPTPSGGANTTAPKAIDKTFTAYDTPNPGQTQLMRITPNTENGKINDSINLIFKVAAGQRGAHNLRIPDLGITTQLDGVGVGGMKNVTITLTKTGTFRYFCNLNPGQTAQTSHDALGMNGQFTVSA